MKKVIANRAKTLFESGLCCSESVVMTFAEAANVPNPEMFMKMSSGLCGGLGKGKLCGALSGGACAIGLFLGREDLNGTPKLKCSTISKKLVDHFEEKFQSCECDELIKDLPRGTPEQRARCAIFVEEVATMAATLINEEL